MLLAEVAVPVPLGRAFSYSVPPALADRVVPGVRIVCEFGRRRALAVVLEVGERTPSFDPRKIKPIAAVLDDEPAIPAELLAFLRELAAYYFAPIGEVLRLALPAMERTRVRVLEEQDQDLFAGIAVPTVGGRRHAVARLVERAQAPADLRGHARAIFERLRENGEEPVARLQERFSTARVALKKLAALGVAEIHESEEPLKPLFSEPVPREPAPDLTAAQREAATAIEGALGEGRGQAFLLHGVTGSGKTEVYLRAIAACRAARRGALVLVPEIALTPQLVARFRARFGDDLAVLHSGLAERARHEMWRSLRDRRVHVAIGARSALFAPVPDIGLLVVDEEHDPSFKQEEGVRYHARDMAMLRAHRARAVTVLGSATPSLETEWLARSGKIQKLSLPDRAHAEAVLPEIEIVDRKKYRAGPTGDPLLTQPLYRAIEAALAAGDQTILFLNRRGFAPSVMCASCGEILSCKHCSVALTFHRAGGGLVRCHYCDFEGRLPGGCASCNTAGSLTLEGLGTEKLEATIGSAFPNARIARLDRDIASGVKAETVLARVRRREVDILVGTQMVTKGHDLPRVTVVGVVNADAALSMPDFRATERAFQLLVQVAGRAGRGDRPGKVLIQTLDPDHPAIRFATRHDVSGFAEQELAARQEVRWPPFSRLALLRFDSLDEAAAREEAARMVALLRTAPESRERKVAVLPPKEATVFRVRGRYRMRVVLRSISRQHLRALLVRAAAAAERVASRVHVVIDVDPVQMI